MWLTYFPRRQHCFTLHSVCLWRFFSRCRPVVADSEDDPAVNQGRPHRGFAHINCSGHADQDQSRPNLRNNQSRMLKNEMNKQSIIKLFWDQVIINTRGLDLNSPCKIRIGLQLLLSAYSLTLYRPYVVLSSAQITADTEETFQNTRYTQVTQAVFYRSISIIPIFEWIRTSATIVIWLYEPRGRFPRFVSFDISLHI